MLLHDLPARTAAKLPQSIALVYRDRSLTYEDLATNIERLAAGFSRLLPAGSRAALLLPNGSPFVLSYYALSRAGITVVPANPLLKPAELSYMWQDANITAAVVAAPLLSVAAEAAHGSGIPITIISVGETDVPGIETVPFQTLAESATGELPPSVAGPDDCAVIIYTSGTTGKPKGAMLSHRNLTRNVEQMLERLPLTDEDSILTVLPCFHAFAATVCLNLACAAGMKNVIHENFSPIRILESIEAHRITVLPAVPAMFQGLLMVSNDRVNDFSSLRMLVSGGAPLPIPVLSALEARFGAPVLEGDGPTECSPVTSVNPLEGPRKAGSVGPPLPGVEVRIVADNNEPLPVGESGEIVVRGDNVMLGYLNQPQATAEAMQGGWYHTGDIGMMDEDDYVYILDRKKDMIISAGLNVYPREVEEIIMQHAKVADVAVIGVPDALRGEVGHAFVVLKPDLQATEREIIRHCRERVADYKAPRSVQFIDALPRGATGKVVKRLLRKEMELNRDS